MKLHVKVSYLKPFKNPKFEKLIQWRDEEKFVDVDASQFTEAQLDKLIDLAKAALAKDEKAEGARGLISKIASWRNIQADPEGKKIGRLEMLAAALRAYIEPSPNRWVFYDEDDGHALPYYVENIKYHPPERHSPANVTMSLAAITRGEKDGKSISWHRDDLGDTVSEILNASGYYLETEAAVKKYEEDIELHKKYSPKTGGQFRCVGTGFPMDSYSYSSMAMEREGIPAKVVVDDIEEEERGTRRNRSDGALTSNAFWVKPMANPDDEDDEDEEVDTSTTEPVDSVPTPVHPYVKVFDLDQHEFVLVHVRNMTPYVYDKSAAGKLVLPKETKELVNILVRGSAEVLEDIIAGKTGGTIVISTGPPGTGKTLTAEVFSEEIERPLYVVQCSQLGTDEDNIEKQLRLVLARASRWGAILLIDEADVYVHERGSDIQQNAIVGVFLRILERYRGVLFLTSNRVTIIDDAIMSRATAWIRYDYPSQQAMRDLWKVLSVQYQMELSEKAITELVEKFPRVSGRNIKNLLKLARMLVRGTKDRVLGVGLFEYVAKFLDLSTDESKETKRSVVASNDAVPAHR